MNKIFGIGLPKSGTSSLHEALKLLGYNSNHNPDDKITEKELRSANYNLSILEKYDAIMDIPIPAIFAQLDEAWPDSKFILTVRPIDAWIESSRRAGFNQSYAVPKPGSTVEFYMTLLFGCNVFDEKRYRWIYETHNKNVKDYFSGSKSDQLLILDLTKGDVWEEICTFLDKPVPDVPIPHANPLSNRKKLSFFQIYIVGVLVKMGFEYRWLRRFARKFKII